MKRTRSTLKTWFSISLAAFLALVLVNLGLPVLLLLLRVSSFTVGNENMWILQWQNETTGSEIQFNVLSLLVIAIGIGLISLVIQMFRNQHG